MYIVIYYSLVEEAYSSRPMSFAQANRLAQHYRARRFAARVIISRITDDWSATDGSI